MRFDADICSLTWPGLELAIHGGAVRDFALSVSQWHANIAGFHSHAIKNKNENRPKDKDQNLENERSYICKDPRQDTGRCNF